MGMTTLKGVESLQDRWSVVSAAGNSRSDVAPTIIKIITLPSVTLWWLPSARSRLTVPSLKGAVVPLSLSRPVSTPTATSRKVLSPPLSSGKSGWSNGVKTPVKTPAKLSLIVTPTTFD